MSGWDSRPNWKGAPCCMLAPIANRLGRERRGDRSVDLRIFLARLQRGRRRERIRHQLWVPPCIGRITWIIFIQSRYAPRIERPSPGTSTSIAVTPIIGTTVVEEVARPVFCA